MANRQEIIVTQRGASKTSRELNKVDRAIGGMVKRALTFTVAAVGVKKALDFSKAAGSFANVERAFRRLAEEPDRMLMAMERATDGMISEMKLMQQFNTAALLGLPLERFDEMLEIAKGAAQATGQSMDFMLTSLVTGIGRQSRLMLDNLGLIVSATEAQKAYRKEMGLGSRKLTEMENKIAFANLALTKGKINLDAMGGAANSAIEPFEKLSATLDNFKVAVGEKLGPILVPILEGLTGLLSKQDTVLGTASTGLLGKFNMLADAYRDLIETSGQWLLPEEVDKMVALDAAMGNIASQIDIGIRPAIDQMAMSFEEIDRLAPQELFVDLNSDAQKAVAIFDQMGDSLATAVIYGQGFGQAVASSLNQIAAEALKNAALFALLQLIPGGTAITGGLNLLQFVGNRTFGLEQEIAPSGGLNRPTTGGGDTNIYVNGLLTGDIADIGEFTGKAQREAEAQGRL